MKPFEISSWLITILAMIIIVILNHEIYDLTGINIYAFIVGAFIGLYFKPKVHEWLTKRAKK